MFHHSLIEIDKKPGGSKHWELLFHQVKLHGPRDGIGGAAPQRTLVTNSRATGAQVNFGRQGGKMFRSRAKKDVALVWELRCPAVTSSWSGGSLASEFACGHGNVVLGG